VSDTQRTVWHLTSAWLRGSTIIVGHIANRIAANDMWYVRYNLGRALYPSSKDLR
jgi:hypothetical protein